LLVRHYRFSCGFAACTLTFMRRDGHFPHIGRATDSDRRSLVRSVRETLSSWFRRARTRRALAELDAYLLDDIGLDPQRRARECAKRFWEA
jgi:uncharacterized protein YjiS (DUF1127 family)